MKDNINPQHYKNGKVECIDALEAATVGKKGIEAVCTANVIKYIWRYEDKNGLEDILKAKWYLDRLIKFREENSLTVEQFKAEVGIGAKFNEELLKKDGIVFPKEIRRLIGSEIWEYKSEVNNKWKNWIFEVELPLKDYHINSEKSEQDNNSYTYYNYILPSVSTKEYPLVIRKNNETEYYYYQSDKEKDIWREIDTTVVPVSLYEYVDLRNGFTYYKLKK